MHRPHFQFRLWMIFALTALVAYLLAWLVVYLAFKNDPPIYTGETWWEP
jgi:hypothetical protein